MSEVPVVDFSAMSLDIINNSDLDPAAVEDLSQKLVDSFSTIGFVYLSNTAVPEDMLEKVHSMSKNFFALPVEKKGKYSFKLGSSSHGWTKTQQENVADISQPGDLMESYCLGWDALINNESIPFDEPEVVTEFYRICTRLTHRLLKAIAVGLQLENTDFLVNCHNPLTPQSATRIVMLFYPPALGGVNPGKHRLVEHRDFGTFTLLFPDDAGGLEIRNRENQLVDVRVIPGTVLVNIAALMQRWTADRLIAPRHRVVVTDNESRMKLPRCSIAFLVMPDDDVLVTCLDGSDKYEPELVKDYNRTKYIATYQN